MAGWTDLLPIALQDALYLVGFVSIVLGLLVRERGGNNQGLGLSISLVGVCLVLAGPMAKLLGWW
ncbi:MAG: hypothetical protein AAF224_13125 [Pseudomonadota bacterium]